jgi:hypothetical protein
MNHRRKQNNDLRLPTISPHRAAFSAAMTNDGAYSSKLHRLEHRFGYRDE